MMSPPELAANRFAYVVSPSVKVQAVLPTPSSILYTLFALAVDAATSNAANKMLFAVFILSLPITMMQDTLLNPKHCPC
jgi:hypothetical protein